MGRGACLPASSTAGTDNCRWILGKPSRRVRRNVIQLPAIVTIPRERLVRAEPAIAVVTATHALIVLALTDGVWPGFWAMAAALLGLGVTGLAGLRTRVMVLVRILTVALVGFSTAYLSGGIGSTMTIWLAVGALFYPAVISERWSWAYLPVASLGYLSLGFAPTNEMSWLTGIIRLALVASSGYLVWGLRSSSERLEEARHQLETELKRVEGRFAVAFDTASIGMAIMGLDGEIETANQGLADLLGSRAKDLADSQWTDFIHDEDRDRVSLLTSQLIAADIWSFQEEVRCMTTQGQVVWVLLGMAVITDSQGDPLYLFANFQDITSRVATEVSLRHNEEHYRNLFKNSPIPTWECDYGPVAEWLDGIRSTGVIDLGDHLRFRPDLVSLGLSLVKMRDVNDAAVHLLETDSAEKLPAGFSLQLASERTRHAVISQFEAIWNDLDRTKADVDAVTLRGRRIEGIMHWVAPSVEGVRDLSRVTLAVADITQHRAAELALERIEERLRAVVSAAPILLFALDQHGVFTLAEGQALAALGLTPGKVMGRSAFELFRESPDMIRSVRRVLSGEAFTTAIDVAGRVFDTRLSPLWEENQVAGVIGVANDVTERKLATEQLEKLLRTKDQFVAGVSHELRTPLTAVVGFAEELRDGLHHFDRQELEGFVQLIAEQSIEVADLVEDLLVAARSDLDSVAISPEAVELREQVDFVLAPWPASEAERVSIKGSPAKAYADPIRLRQIVRNLLTNAQRYGGELIAVETIEGEREVRLCVRDNGEGVPLRDRDRIFEPYFQANRVEGVPASVGLGLTVSRQLARLMDGDLQYRYEDGWSVFELVLPSS